ncbi:MAG: tRNA (adenosine(37)-N6)-threonylcarbamoyltransferase complex ATPase subunit type 1 TsaE [Candidatus Epulonipiscioides saccharophilum]|nr:MAG: tRNA (adenosine(37)-N6)-threonylcarbamoyltransferase complex ATPase subunit type 1 TsaE [Epulopiscium sp. AS2M-Bin001]
MNSLNEKDTHDFAFNLAQSAKKGDIYCLIGDLGTGKTIFSKGFALGLDITEEVTSPTFNIVSVYDNGRIPLYHFDMYRIEDIEELYNIGFEEYFYGDGVCLIEWANKVSNEIPTQAKWIYITKDLNIGENFRKIEVKQHVSISN